MWALLEWTCDGISLLPGNKCKERYLPSEEKAWNWLQSADNLPGGFKCFGGSALPMYSWSTSNILANTAWLTDWGSPYFPCLKHAAARTVWILPLASPCLPLSCVSVPSILIQKPSELYLWAAEEGEHCCGRNNSWHSAQGVGNLSPHLLLSRGKLWGLNYTLRPAGSWPGLPHGHCTGGCLTRQPYAEAEAVSCETGFSPRRVADISNDV